MHILSCKIENYQSFSNVGFGNKNNILNNTVKKTRKRYLTEFQVELMRRDYQILELLKQGISKKEIMERLNVSYSAVNKVARENNIISNYRTEINQRNNTILDLLKQGFSIKNIAERLSLKYHIVNKVAQDNNIRLPHLKKKEEVVLAKLANGLSVKEIAKEEKLSFYTIVRIAQKNNVEYQHKLKIEARNAKIKEDILNGVSLPELAEKYNLEIANVRKIRRDLGLSPFVDLYAKNKENFAKNKEIKKQSSILKDLREKHSMFKKGEKTPELIDEMLLSLDVLKEKLLEFKTKFI